MLEGILQPTHLLFVLVIALIVIGPKRLPETGRSLGQGLRSFKDGISNHTDAVHNTIADVSTPTPAPAAAPAPVATPAGVTPPPVAAAAPVAASAPTDA